MHTARALSDKNLLKPFSVVNGWEIASLVCLHPCFEKKKYIYIYIYVDLFSNLTIWNEDVLISQMNKDTKIDVS